MHRSLPGALLIVFGLVAGALLASRATAQAPSPQPVPGARRLEDRGQRGAEGRAAPGMENPGGHTPGLS